MMPLWNSILELDYYFLKITGKNIMRSPRHKKKKKAVLSESFETKPDFQVSGKPC